MLPDLTPDWGAVLAAGVLYMVLGMLWYGVLFEKAWLRAMGKTADELKAESANLGKIYSTSFVLSLVAAIGLNDIIKMANTAAGGVTVLEGALLGLAVALAFVVTTQLIPILYEGRSKETTGLFIGYQLTWFIIIGAMFAWWPAGWP